MFKKSLRQQTRAGAGLAGAIAMAAALAAMPGASRAAEAKGAFVSELRAQNAQHLSNRPALPGRTPPKSVERDWEDKISNRSWELSDGPLRVSVALAKSGPPDGLLFTSPVVTLFADGKEVLKSEGSESFPDNPVFLVQIAEMDPGNPYPEVVFSTYTGGAHCCSSTRVLASSKDGKIWSEIAAGEFDGGPLGAYDYDGDGRFEFAMRDNAFLYTFGCYACSTAPLHILRLENGALKDASADPAFRARHVESLVEMIEWADQDSDRNGYLAGYVAQKILLGEGAQAWAFMLKHHDRESDWGLDFCAVKVKDGGDCPPGKTAKLTYPRALEKFLKETGYKLEK